MSHRHDPLSPEERAMAEALARALPRNGPTPEVDAAVLASARTALSGQATAPATRRRRRWPAALGVAASLVFAVGIAWQLRPVPQEAIPAMGEGPLPSGSAQAPADSSAAPSPVHTRPAAEAVRPPVPAPAPTAADAPPAEAPAKAPARPPAAEQAPKADARTHRAPSPSADNRQTAPAPTEAQTVRPAPTSPPAPRPEAHSAAPASALRLESQREITSRIEAEEPPASAQPRPASPTRAKAPPPAPPAPPAPPPPPPLPVEQEADAGQAAEASHGDVVFEGGDLHGDPPATVDSPAFQRLWLERIRELRDAGELEAARESLREYRRRYPSQSLPDDLDGLLEE